MYVIDKLSNRTCLRTTLQVSSKIVKVTLSKSLSHFRSFVLICFYSEPMGVYGTSTWFQGVTPTPSALPAASSSDCQSFPTIGVTPLRRRQNGPVGRHPIPTTPPST